MLTSKVGRPRTSARPLRSSRAPVSLAIVIAPSGNRPMTQDAKIRALSIFDDYLDASESEQASVRAQLHERDPELLEALLTLVQADAASSMLDLAPAQVLAQARSADPPQTISADPRIGTRLGPWQIDALIAEGGMGSVYAAHRADGQYEQRAALKCVRATLTSPALLQAFLAERNHLARLEHSGIATLLDGGVGEDGQPWLVMRLVDGVALDAWCERRRAGLDERVALLLQASEALAYAHAQGIVHSDIKPSNLLVSADGRVHLVDFGIALHVVAQDAPSPEPVALTHDYAAPEARAHGVRTALTDQYALGVLAYRLLCGQWPTPLHGLRDLIPVSGPIEPISMERLLDRAALHGAVSDDSAGAAIAQHRGMADIPTLRKAIAGDLSAIALKAVATRPQDRYSSINAFAEDLRRWREHRPVAAHPGNGLWRLRKWRKRSPAMATLSAAVLLTVCATVGLSLWLQHRTAHEIESTRTVSRLFASTLGTATLSGLGSSRFSSRALLEKVERELAQLPLDDQPGLYARSLATLARSYGLIGDYRNAERLATQAQRVLGSAEDENSFIAATWVAMLNTNNHHAAAVQRAREQIERLGAREDRQAQLAQVIFGAELVKAQWNLGDTAVALEGVDQLLQRARALGRDHAELLAQVLIMRARFLNGLHRFGPAEADAREAIGLVRQSNPVLADDALELLVWISGRRISPDEHALAQELLRGRAATLGPSHPITARAHVLLALSQYPQATASSAEVSQALATIASAYGRDNLDYGWALSASSWAIARNPRENIDLLREGVSILERSQGPKGILALNAKGNLGKDLLKLPEAVRGLGDIAEGTALLRKIIDDKHSIGVPAPRDRVNLIRGLLQYGDESQLAQAERLLGEARIDSGLYYAANDTQPALVELLQGMLLLRRGQYVQADLGLARLVGQELERLDGSNSNSSGSNGPGSNNPDSNRRIQSQRNRNAHLTVAALALAYRGLYALQTCHRDEANKHLDDAHRLIASAPAPDAALVRALDAYRDDAREHPALRAPVVDSFAHATVIEETNRRWRACQQGPRS